jgi:hypothetical protein
MENVGHAKGLSETPKPSEYFDLIGGTSTGGLIAIMLGLLGMVTFTGNLTDTSLSMNALMRTWNYRVKSLTLIVCLQVKYLLAMTNVDLISIFLKKR